MKTERSGDLMKKKKILDFLFNENKYRFTKFLLIPLFFIVAIIIGNNLSDFKQVYIVYYVPVLTFVLVIFLINITWYNKKYNIKTRIIDKVQLLIMVLFIIVFFYVGKLSIIFNKQSIYYFLKSTIRLNYYKRNCAFFN